MSKKFFKEFASGKHGYESIAQYLGELDVKSKNGKLRSNYSIRNLLTNELYIGIMRWKDEVYEGKYQPLILKQLFAKV